MNRLDLAKRIRIECAIGGSGPGSTANQDGEYLRIINWLDSAYESIQTKRSDFLFLREDFESTLTIGEAVYTPTEMDIDDLANWITRDVKLHIGSFSNEQLLTYIPWDDFKASYLLGSNRTTSGRPVMWTVKPDKSVQFSPIPSQAFVCNGEYYQKPDVMDDDDDIPIFPSEFHIAIVWRAIMYYSPYAGEADRWLQGRQEYSDLMRRLIKDQTPKYHYGAPLA